MSASSDLFQAFRINRPNVVSESFEGEVVIVNLDSGCYFSLLGSAANVHNILLPFQLMGGEVIANLLTPYVRGLLSGLGAVTLIGSLVLSLLLFAIGRLLGMVAAQEARLAYLEAQQVNNSALRA